MLNFLLSMFLVVRGHQLYGSDSHKKPCILKTSCTAARRCGDCHGSLILLTVLMLVMLQRAPGEAGEWAFLLLELEPCAFTLHWLLNTCKYEISGDGERRKMVPPPPSPIYRAGLIRNRHGLFVLSEPALPPALPALVSPLENTCIFIVVTPFQTWHLPPPSATPHLWPSNSTPMHGDKTRTKARIGLENKIGITTRERLVVREKSEVGEGEELAVTNNHGEPKKMEMKKKKESERGPRRGKMTAHGRLRNCSDQSRRQALSGGFFSDANFHFRHIWGLCEGGR